MVRRIGWGLAVWSVAFAMAHVAWALGWRGGVPDDVAPISQRPVFLTYDVVAAVLMIAAAVVAVLLTRELDPAVRRRLEIATIVGSVAALLRGVPALAIDLAAATFTGLGFVADLWFVVSGVLGLLLWRASRRDSALAG